MAGPVKEPEVFPSLAAILQADQKRFREATYQDVAQEAEVVGFVNSVGVVAAEVEEGKFVADLTAVAEDQVCIAAFGCP